MGDTTGSTGIVGTVVNATPRTRSYEVATRGRRTILLGSLVFEGFSHRPPARRIRQEPLLVERLDERATCLVGHLAAARFPRLSVQALVQHMRLRAQPSQQHLL